MTGRHAAPPANRSGTLSFAPPATPSTTPNRYAKALLLLPADRHKLGLGEGIGDGLPSWLTE